MLKKGFIIITIINFLGREKNPKNKGKLHGQKISAL